MKIGELATPAKTQVETIRYYEREGLLPQAPRGEGGYRIYRPKHVERLAFVRHCRALDMTLDAIRVLLRFKDGLQAESGEIKTLLDEHIGHIATRTSELRQLEKHFNVLPVQCGGVREAAQCGILNQPTRSGSPTNSKLAGRHVPCSYSGCSRLSRSATGE